VSEEVESRIKMIEPYVNRASQLDEGIGDTFVSIFSSRSLSLQIIFRGRCPGKRLRLSMKLMKALLRYGNTMVRLRGPSRCD